MVQEISILIECQFVCHIAPLVFLIVSGDLKFVLHEDFHAEFLLSLILVIFLMFQLKSNQTLELNYAQLNFCYDYYDDDSIE